MQSSSPSLLNAFGIAVLFAPEEQFRQLLYDVAK